MGSIEIDDTGCGFSMFLNTSRVLRMIGITGHIAGMTKGILKEALTEDRSSITLEFFDKLFKNSGRR